MTDQAPYHHTSRRNKAGWYPLLLGMLLVALGLVIGAGGVWLIALGGSWYYAIAGLGLIASGALMVLGRYSGVLIYGATYVFTIVWALWEVGLQGWPLVPRLVAPTVILLLVLLAIPGLRRSDRQAEASHRRGTAIATALLAVLGIGLIAAPWIEPPRVLAQAEGDETAPASGDTAQPPVDPSINPPIDPSDLVLDEDQQGAPSPDSQSDAVINPETPRDPALEGQSAEETRSALTMRETGADWPAWGGNLHGTKYSPLDQITPENVGQLERIWEFHTGDLPSSEAEGKYSPENTPLKIGEKLFTCTPMGRIISIDAQSGKEEWHFDPQVPEDAIPYGATCRGVSYFEVPDADPYDPCATRIIWGTLDARLIAIDAQTGRLCSEFGDNGMVYLERGLGETVPGWYAMSSPPTIVRGVVVVGAQVTDGNAEDSPSGVIRGFDAVTGDFEWAWDMGRPGDNSQAGPDDIYTRGTPNMWTVAAGDEELGYVFLPLGNSAVDYYGSNRSEQENEFSTSLVALDVTTGEPAWHFQTVHRDVWDYDLGSQPTLVDFPTDAGTVPAIILASKQGDIYILNRETGESLFPVEERPVPQGGVEPDYISATQPFSTYHT
ncbi:MAG: membrane-bound PQQ-dependent dehydrogenase, glucose/quinate/shikimate family, partial [Pseudomonadota bacterium]|nr:membrane-bound PQQ-dependent dehydrogenase, glucose/quinate/shikimate family [Pseudomonadota bacterium]